MTGPELKQLRHDLGDSIGRRLSVADMAKLCGLAPKNGADTMRKWEAGDGPSGPVAALLSILSWAAHIPPGVADDEIPGPASRVLQDIMRDEVLRRLS